MKTVLVIGPSAYVRELQHAVNGTSQTWHVVGKNALLRLPFVDALIIVGGPQPEAWLAASARRLRIPIAIVWTGPDISIIDRAYDGAAHVRARRFYHAALSPRVRNELSGFGIEATVVPDPSHVEALERFFHEVWHSLPSGKRHAVVSGSPRRVAAFVEAAARTMPDWEFHAAISGSGAERFDDALSLVFAERWYRIGDQREDRIFRFTSKLLRKQRYKASVRPVTDSPRESRLDTENLSASSTNL